MRRTPPPGAPPRARLDRSGQDETHFLQPLIRIAKSGKSPAEELLELYDTEWGGKVDPVFKFQSYLEEAGQVSAARG